MFSFSTKYNKPSKIICIDEDKACFQKVCGTFQSLQCIELEYFTTYQNNAVINSNFISENEINNKSDHDLNFYDSNSEEFQVEINDSHENDELNEQNPNFANVGIDDSDEEKHERNLENAQNEENPNFDIENSKKSFCEFEESCKKNFILIFFFKNYN